MMERIPYTDRDLATIQLEIDAYEDSTSHEALPARYDALVALRNRWEAPTQK